MDITAFIRELLFGHDCVIVPGFGGFIGNYTPASIDNSSGTFYPPVKQISFNRNLNHNDGLLIGRISASATVTYGDARSMVEEFVGETKRKLEKGDKVIFDMIGSFVYNHEGNIQFEPDKNANYHLDSYGLESFHCQPLEGYDVRKRIMKKPLQSERRRYPVRKILLRAAVIVPLLSVLIAVPLRTDRFRSKVEETSLNPLVMAEFEQNKKADDAEKNIIPAEVPETKSSENIIVTDNTAEQPGVRVPGNNEPVQPEAVSVKAASSQITSPVYFLITGSFKTENNALQQAKLLEQEGFSPEIVTASNGFYRVSAMMCPDLNTAMTRKDSISKKFPGTWISKKR